MQRIRGLLITPQAPLEISIKTTSENVIGHLNLLIGAVIPSNCGNGTVLYCGNNDDIVQNEIATQLRQKNSHNTSDSVVRGKAILFNENENGDPCSVTKETIKTINGMYARLGDNNKNKRKKNKPNGPHKPKSAWRFFNDVHTKERREELKNNQVPAVFADVMKYVKEKWDNSSDDVKLPYVNMANKDLDRYQSELLAFQKINPVHPKRPRNAYNLYCKQMKCEIGSLSDVAKSWKEMDEQSKLKYMDMASMDMERYKKEMEYYRQLCDEQPAKRKKNQ